MLTHACVQWTAFVNIPVTSQRSVWLKRMLFSSGLVHVGHFTANCYCDYAISMAAYPNTFPVVLVVRFDAIDNDVRTKSFYVQEWNFGQHPFVQVLIAGSIHQVDGILSSPDP